MGAEKQRVIKNYAERFLGLITKKKDLFLPNFPLRYSQDQWKIREYVPNFVSVTELALVFF